MRVLILGAAGRDSHDFNVVFRGRPSVDVVAFTRTPGQSLGELGAGTDRRYPAELAGEGYPEGIPIEPEERLEELVRTRDVDQVVFSYSDVANEHVMHLASRALAAGADFRLIGPDEMMLPTDAHDAGELDYLHLGVAQARRGWCSAEEVLNTRPLDEVVSYFGR